MYVYNKSKPLNICTIFAVLINYGKINCNKFHNKRIFCMLHMYYKNIHKFIYVYTYYKSISLIIFFSYTFQFNTQQLYNYFYQYRNVLYYRIMAILFL